MRKWFRQIVYEVVTELLVKFWNDLNTRLALRDIQRSAPVEVFTRMTAEDVVRYGEALDELAQGPHYKYLVDLVKRRRAQVGELALQGGPSLEYWKGFRDGAESLEVLVDPMRKNANKLIAEKKDGGATMRDFLGMGEGPTVS